MTVSVQHCKCGGQANVFRGGRWLCWPCLDKEKPSPGSTYDPVMGDRRPTDPSAERIKYLEGIIVSATRVGYTGADTKNLWEEGRAIMERDNVQNLARFPGRYT